MASARFWRVSVVLASAMKLVKPLRMEGLIASKNFLSARSDLRIFANSGGRSMTSSPRSGVSLMSARLPGADAGACLHLFIHDEDVALTLGAGDERGLEGEAVDLAEDAAALPHGPRLLEVDGDARQ